MKILLKIASIALFSLQICNADVTDKLIGTWSGTATATSNGIAVSQKTSTVYKRYEGSGLLAVTTVKVSGQKMIGTSRYHKSGMLEGELKRNGSVVAVISGTWTATNTVLTTKVKAEGLFPSFKQTAKSTLVTVNRLNISGTSSTGDHSVGSLTRK